MPKRIRRMRIPGWKMPPNTVYVGRPSKWGNPYQTGTNPLEEVLKWYEQLLDFQLKEGILNIEELRGKNLACWCRLDEPCHADLLLKRANK